MGMVVGRGFVQEFFREGRLVRGREFSREKNLNLVCVVSYID